MTVWVVRAGKYAEGESFALENSCAVVGWDDMPALNGFPDWDALKTGVRTCYPEISDKVVSNWTGQLWSFANEIKKGDLVVLPRKGTGTVAIGEAQGTYTHDARAAPATSHQQAVTWINTALSRNRIDDDILFSMGGTLTVFQVRRDNAENRVRALLKQPGPTGTSDHTVSSPTLQTVMSAPQDLRVSAIDQIRKRIGQRFKGHKLSGIVAAVLEAKGFEVDVKPPGPDGGVDILATQGFFGGGPINLVVQVKSEETATDARTVRELIGVMDKYQAPRGLFVAWGGFKTSVKSEFERDYFRLQFWTSDDLIREILESYDRFDEALKSQLPLERIWVLVQDQDSGDT